MRNPVDRAISHYNYWISTYNPDTASLPQKRVIEESWSLERFCLSSEFQNIYSQYLWGFPLEIFSFIGITEFFDDDLTHFSRQHLEGDLSSYSENVGAKKANKYDIDADLRKKIESHHSHDVSLYKRALQLRRTSGPS
jgi:hypothetical protein